MLDREKLRAEFREYINEAKFKFRVGMKIEYKDSKLGKEIVKVEQVLKSGDARFYLSDGREMEVSPEDNHLYTQVK